MKLKIVLEPAPEGGWTATAPALPGCVSEGETLEEARQNIREAIDLWLEVSEGDFVVAGGAQVEELEL